MDIKDKLKRISQEIEKTTRNQTKSKEPHKRNKYLGYLPRKILGTIAEVELKQMKKRTRKSMTMHKAFYPKDDVDKLNVSRKEYIEHTEEILVNRVDLFLTVGSDKH